MKTSNSKCVTLETCLTKLDKVERKLGPEYHMLVDLVKAAITSRESYWVTVKNDKSNRPNYICSDCGAIQAAPVRYCPMCGGCKVDLSGKIKKQ